jgi:hypothetical protein
MAAPNCQAPPDSGDGLGEVSAPCDTGSVHPILECVREGQESSLVAVYGYESESRQRVSVPIGPQNEFSPKPANRGQPASFLAGRHDGVLEVAWDGHEPLRRRA